MISHPKNKHINQGSPIRLLISGSSIPCQTSCSCSLLYTMVDIKKLVCNAFDYVWEGELQGLGDLCMA